MKQSVKIDGVQYKSRVAAGKVLVANGMSLGDAAEKVGCTYQTLYANTKGADKVNVRRAKYRVLTMGQTGKRTASEIAKKVGLNVSKVVAILKGAKITVVTKKAKAAAKTAKAGKTPKAIRQKVTKPENLINIPEPIDEVPLTPAQITAEEVTDEIPTDDAAAEAAAKADMAVAE